MDDMLAILTRANEREGMTHDEYQSKLAEFFEAAKELDRQCLVIDKIVKDAVTEKLIYGDTFK